MMNRIQIAWSTLQRSFEILSQNKTLLVFPVVSAVGTTIAAIFFLSPLVVMKTGQGGGLGILAVLYVVSMFVSTFFNVAFYHAILNAFRGGPVEVGESLKFASGKLPAIFMWSLMAGLVGLAIRKLEERAGFIGQIVIGLIGATWSVAATFAVPALVVTPEATNPIDILKISASAVRKAWGEDLAGFLGFQALNLLVVMGSLGWLAVATFAGFSGWPRTAFSAVGLWMLTAFFVMYVMGVATDVFRGALFIYATEGSLPGGYTKEQIEAAWKKKSA
jgi:uncharacterized membrane protein YeaQ/YmgE (transglycosylase-associated protein family)